MTQGQASTKRVYNFSAGPSCLPFEVLQTCQADMLNWKGSGMSVMEMSHRGKDFVSIYDEATADLRQLLDVPQTHEILFAHGGATMQFAAIPLNLFTQTGPNQADFAITGSWSEKAQQECKKYGQANIACDPGIVGAYDHIPNVEEWSINADARYLHYCANETVHGVEFQNVPNVPLPLVSDMSSNFCSKPIDVSKHLVIYGGVQKNLGPAGAAVVIVDKAALSASNGLSICPSLLDYRISIKHQSMYNTPSCWTIYVTGLVAKSLKQSGGLSAAAERSEAKSQMLYDFIDSSEGYFVAPVQREYRSRMNVPFKVGGGNPTLENRFVKEATAAGLVYLAGHRSVGGCRASLYNAMPMEGVLSLIEFMTDFKEANPVDGP